MIAFRAQEIAAAGNNSEEKTMYLNNVTHVAAVMLFAVCLIAVNGCAQSNTPVPEKKAASSSKAVEKEKQSAPQATFLELGSVNCVPCKMMKPVIDEIEKIYGDNVKIVFYDVWTREGSPYGRQYRIRAIPTQVFLDTDGKEFFRHVGFFPTDEIVKVLDKQGVEKAGSAAEKPAGKPGT